MHGARSLAFDDAGTDARASHFALISDTRRALGCIATLPLTMVAADHAARRRTLATQEAIRATRLRALAAEIVAVRSTVVATDRPAAIHAVAGLIAAVPVAAEEALVTATAFAVVAGRTPSGVTTDQAK